MVDRRSLPAMGYAASWRRSPLLVASVGVYSGIGSWIGLPVTADLDLGDKFGAIGATAMTKAAGLQFIPQGGELNVFRLME